MTTTVAAAEVSEAAIFARIWDVDGQGIPPELARHVLKLGFGPADRERMHRLAVKNQDGKTTPDELAELDHYIRVADLLALLQSKARLSLRKAP